MMERFANQVIDVVDESVERVDLRDDVVVAAIDYGHLVIATQTQVDAAILVIATAVGHCRSSSCSR